MDGQRMHRVGDQIADAVEDCPVAGEARQPEELLGHDCHGKVPCAPRGAGVPDVQGAVVADFQHPRRERREPASRA